MGGWAGTDRAHEEGQWMLAGGRDGRGIENQGQTANSNLERHGGVKTWTGKRIAVQRP